MQEHLDKNKKKSDEHLAAPEEIKPPYQAPVVMPLGGVFRGQGQGCAPGSAAGGGGCATGNNARGGCRNGNSATSPCGGGGSAGSSCGTGSQAGAACNSGSSPDAACTGGGNPTN